MEPITEIMVSCQGATTVLLDELRELQGELKDLTEENYVKLRNSLVKFGFSFPIFMWQDNEGTKWVVDAHQRLRTLRKMRSEGITVPALPADYIHAKDKIEAKEKLLLLNSQYGHMTQEGFDAFTADIPMDDISDLLALDNVMFEGMGGEKPFENTNQELSSEELAKDLNITCPKCGFQFKGREGLIEAQESTPGEMDTS